MTAKESAIMKNSAAVYKESIQQKCEVRILCSLSTSPCSLSSLYSHAELIIAFHTTDITSRIE